MRGRVTSAALALLACLLGACGGEDESAAQKQVRAAVTKALKTKSPDSCSTLFTRRFVEQTTLERGRAAIRSCRMNAGDPAATSVTVTDVTVDGRTAHAAAQPRGGGLPFKSVTIGLVDEQGDWKVDRIKSGTLDRAVFFRSTRKDLRAPPDALSEASTDCVLRDFKTTTDADIVRLYLGGDPRLLLLPITLCQIRNDISRKPELKPFVTCIARRTRRELTTGAIGRKITADKRNIALLGTKQFDRAAARIVKSCVSR